MRDLELITKEKADLEKTLETIAEVSTEMFKEIASGAVASGVISKDVGYLCILLIVMYLAVGRILQENASQGTRSRIACLLNHVSYRLSNFYVMYDLADSWV
jgi:hypothetical protein